MDDVIGISGLVKRFGATTALDGLDLRVGAGEVHGFLGPNGSGKSTTIRVLLGLMRADGGRARLFGEDPWRDAVALHRGSLLGWTVAMAFVWVAYGSLGGDVQDLLGDSDLSEALLAPGAASVTDAFYATAVVMLALITSAYGIAAALRARAEETAGRVETLLSGPLARRSWLLGHTSIAAAGSVVVLAAAGLGTGVTLSAATGDGTQVARMLGATPAYAPAVLVLVALTTLAHAVAPRAASLGWLALLACIVVMLFADLRQLPQAVRDLSPFEVLATVPVEPVAMVPVAVLLGVALTLVGVAAWRFERRDLATT